MTVENQRPTEILYTSLGADDIDGIAVIDLDWRKTRMCLELTDIDSPAIHLITPGFKRGVHQRQGTTLLTPHRGLTHKIYLKTEVGFKSPGYRVKNPLGQFAAQLTWQATTH